MADKSISELAVSQSMTDDALLVTYQNGETRSIEGQLIKQYARESTKEYVEGAAQSAKDAAESAETATKEADRAKTEADRAEEILGGDFPTKTEAQGYVDTHNSDTQAHKVLLDGKADLVDIEGIKATADGAKAEAELAHTTAEGAVTRLSDVDKSITVLQNNGKEQTTIITALQNKDSEQDGRLAKLDANIHNFGLRLANLESETGGGVPVEFSNVGKLTLTPGIGIDSHLSYCDTTANICVIFLDFKCTKNISPGTTLFSAALPYGHPFTFRSQRFDFFLETLSVSSTSIPPVKVYTEKISANSIAIINDSSMVANREYCATFTMPLIRIST